MCHTKKLLVYVADFTRISRGKYIASEKNATNVILEVDTLEMYQEVKIPPVIVHDPSYVDLSATYDNLFCVESHDKINWHVNYGRYMMLSSDTNNKVGCNVVVKTVFIYDEEEGNMKSFLVNQKKRIQKQ